MTEIADEDFPRFTESMLAEAAPLAWDWSRQLCRHVNPSGATCAGYHGIWQYLRLFGINTALFADAAFYRGVFGPAIRRGARRVLVSGCADYAMAAVVLWIFAREGVTPDLTVLDACETPLRLNQWYAARQGATLTIATSDILDYRPTAPFDLVCTHSFLGLFAPPAREALIGRWHDVLVPGGLFATVNRIRPDGPELERFSAAQADAFRARVLDEAAARPPHGIARRDLAELADSYVAQNVIYPLRSKAELTALMERGGFAVESLTLRASAPAGRLTGPTMTGGATYAQIACVRR